MTTTDLPLLPAGLERELDAIGVRRASFSRPAAPSVDWSFKLPVLDKSGQPEF